MRHIIRKGETTCHVSKNAQSAVLGDILKNIYFTKSDKKISQGENQK